MSKRTDEWEKKKRDPVRQRLCAMSWDNMAVDDRRIGVSSRFVLLGRVLSVINPGLLIYYPTQVLAELARSKFVFLPADIRTVLTEVFNSREVRFPEKFLVRLSVAHQATPAAILYIFSRLPPGQSGWTGES